MFCDGGLFSCTVCRCAEGSLPSECPGVAVSDDVQDRIYNGHVDFRYGAWIEVGSPHAPGTYRQPDK